MRSCLGFFILVAVLAGCAGGSWLESPAEELTAIAPPPSGYPTAVRPAAAAAKPAAETPAPASPPTPIDLNPNPPPAQPEHLAGVKEPPPAGPALAVVPPHLRKTAPPPDAALAPLAAVEHSPLLPGLPSLNLSDEPGLAPIVSASSLKPAPAAAAVEPAPTAAELPATSTAERATDVERQRASLIAALEADIRDRRSASAQDPELPQLEQELRLAYLLSGRLDDAVAAVESLDQPQREAYKDLMFGLGVWLSPDESRRAPLRSAKVLRSLRDAATDLAAASKLEIRKLVFCEKVEYYGWYTEFPRSEFTPKQEVLLYVEVENFSAEHKSAAGFETELQGRYEILDSRGQIVAERELPLDKEVCRNYRRDYFLVYHVYIPEGLSAGRYRLELSLEDRKAGGKYQGRKFGEGMIEFSVR